MIEVDNSEELDEEAVDDPSGTGSSEVPNHCPQCGKGFSTPGNLSAHIKGVHGPKKECSYCHKMINSIEIKRLIREGKLTMGDTRVPRAGISILPVRGRNHPMENSPFSVNLRKTQPNL